MAARVLLVEADEGVRLSVTKALRARGVGVDAYGGAIEALSAVQAGGVWARALLDLNHPELDGVTLAERLLAHLPELEITFAAGGADARVLCRAHALGVVVWKPLGLGPLCERFGVATRRSGVVLRRVTARAPQSAAARREVG